MDLTGSTFMLDDSMSDKIGSFISTMTFLFSVNAALA